MLGNNVGRLILSPATKSLVQQRFRSAICGPPTVHVSGIEKKVLGTFMCASFLAIPAWVLAHISEYRSPK